MAGNDLLIKMQNVMAELDAALAECARVKAESLRVVKVGQPCMACKSETNATVTIKDYVGVFRRTGYGGGKDGAYIIFTRTDDNEEVKVPIEESVQPVYLTSWEDGR